VKPISIELIVFVLGIAAAVILGTILFYSIAKKQKSDTKTKDTEDKSKTISILKNILNSLDSMIYVTVPKTGKILFVNDQMKKRYRIEFDCIGQLCYKLFQEGLYEKCVNCPCYQLDEDPGRIIEWVEFNAITKRTYRYTSYYIEWADGEMVHLQQSVDVTEINDAKEQAIEANRVKSGFLAKISHEIRSPMNVILGITEMQLGKNDLLPDKREAWERVYNSGYLLLSIINDLLDLSKIEAGKLKLTPVIYDVANMINDAVQLNIMRFEGKPIQFVLQADENIPSTLFGDDLRIKQILNNILSNSYKYTDKGEVSLSVTAEVLGMDVPVTMIFKISDTGSGMTQEQVKGLFEDYTRFNMVANRTTEGTGLGMSITRRLVETMSGEISVESEPGKGTVVTIWLPQGYVDSAVLGKEGTENLQRLYAGKISQPKKAPQIVREYMPYGRILVVDDMEPNLYVAMGLMAPYGLSIETVSSGYAAIDLIKSGMTYDIIFMDHFMPGMDGVETTKIIRGIGYQYPIIALTANALAGQVEMFLSNGFDGFMSKPIDIRQLNSALNKFVRDRYPAGTVEAARKLKGGQEHNTGKTASFDLSNKKALVVDDFLPNLNLAAGIIRKYKIQQVDSVLSGREAVDRVKSREPEYDIIFMDHLMPDIDGVEAVRQIRSLGTEYAKNVPIVALTAITPNEAAEKEKMFLENGFQAVLAKPLSVSKLDAFIKNWMGEKTKNDTASDGKDKNIKIEIPGVDEGKVMELYAGDMEIFLPVLRSYALVMPETLEKMSQVSSETLQDYIVKVHGVKSASESIGAEEARRMALELEMQVKNGDLAGVLAKNDAFLQYVRELLGNIQVWLDRIDAR
jgi:signal transduction histidine kinase/DNA-binding response OmpR family regulator